MLRNNLMRNAYIKYFSILFSGAAFAQLLYFITLPFISRLYSVEDFSVLSVFTSVLILLSTIACFRYDLAISFAESEQETIMLFIISIIGVLLFSLFTFLIVTILYFIIDLQKYFFLLPISVFLCGSSNAVLNFYLRFKEYNYVSKVKVLQTSTMVGSQLVLGSLFNQVAYYGLLIGQILNYSAGGVFQLKKILTSYGIKKFKFIELKTIASKYSHYFRYSMLDSIFNLIGLHIPIIILTLAYNNYTMGLFFMIMRIVQVPLGVISSSVSQMYYSNIQERISRKVATTFSMKIVGVLSVLSVLFFGFLYILREPLILTFLGKKWLGISDLLIWLLPWFFFQFISSPISTIMYALSRHKEMMILTFIGFIIRVFPVIILIQLDSDFVIKAFSLLNAIYYLICLVVFLIVCNQGVTKE